MTNAKTASSTGRRPANYSSDDFCDLFAGISKENNEMHDNNQLSSVVIGVALMFSTILSAGLEHDVWADVKHFHNRDFGRATNIDTSSFYSQMLGREIRYSIYLPPSYFEATSRDFPVIYYLHGFDRKGVAHQDWLNWHLDEVLDGLIAAGNVQETIVVMPECFSTGIVVNWGSQPSAKLPCALTFPFRFIRCSFRSAADITYLGAFLFTQRWDLTRSDYADFLTSEFFSHIEEDFRIRDGREFRAICGFSTGGYSALSIAFQNPGLFDSVSAHAPMLISGSPFSPEAKKLFVEFDPEKEQYVKHAFAINLIRRIFVDEETWIANNPIDLARYEPLEGMAIYIDVAGGDKRKYDMGVKELAEVLRQRGLDVQFELIEGLPPVSSHTYPGFLGGKTIAAHAQGKTEEELYERYGWENLNRLINPDMQQIEESLKFHSREFLE
jgi:S-formylglutathione hydrolase FrmB